MARLDEAPLWYWVIGSAFSAYYAYRGAVGNWFAQKQANTDRPEGNRLPSWVIISVYCPHDGLFHFVCAIAGFVVLFVGQGLYGSLAADASIDAGRSVLLVFCCLFGLLGVTGQLPQLILQGKLPTFR
jgi:hypothetical protein